MLFEKTVYMDDFPINIRLVKVQEYPFHYHQDIEFVYVLKGEIYIKNVCHHYLLKEGDIFTNSGHEIHALNANDSDNIVAIIQVSNRYFTQYFPDLPKACFMTYVKNDKSLKLDGLKKMLLNILINYSKRSFDYKSNCIDQMKEIIKYLNQYFNLFAFDGEVVVDFKNTNPVIVERISRIINYIYANHANRITLEEIAEEEHLSTYYVSHLIKNYIGLNFQEFLCFARSEMSEILLLESEKKISTVARDVGFSTTSYYNKFFTKWFGMSPLEYRRMYASHILSSTRPPRLDSILSYDAITLIQQLLSAENGQESNNSIVNKLIYNVSIPYNPQPINTIMKNLEVFITTEDVQVMGEKLFESLADLRANKIILAFKPTDSEFETVSIKDRLTYMGYDVESVFDNGLTSAISSKNDSILAAIQLVRSYFDKRNEDLHCKLRDQGDERVILKGYATCFTSMLIPKTLYTAYKLLRNINGKLLYSSKYCYVIKDDTSINDAYVLVVVNDCERMQFSEMGESSVYETIDLIRSYKDELNVNFDIFVGPGEYVITKYGLSIENSLFYYMNNLNFNDSFAISDPWMKMLNTEPKTQVRTEQASDNLMVNSTIKGTGIQFIRIEKR